MSLLSPQVTIPYSLPCSKRKTEGEVSPPSTPCSLGSKRPSTRHHGVDTTTVCTSTQPQSTPTPQPQPHQCTTIKIEPMCLFPPPYMMRRHHHSPLPPLLEMQDGGGGSSSNHPHSLPCSKMQDGGGSFSPIPLPRSKCQLVIPPSQTLKTCPPGQVLRVRRLPYPTHPLENTWNKLKNKLKYVFNIINIRNT